VPTARELFTEEQIEEFLRLTREHIPRDLAAQQIGTTGSQMKSLARPERDPEFAARYAGALKEGDDFYNALLEQKARKMALDEKNPDRRMLTIELATHHPDYAHLRRDRIRHEGHIAHQHALTIELPEGWQDTMPLDELEETEEDIRRLKARFGRRGGEVIDGEARELPPES